MQHTSRLRSTSRSTSLALVAALTIAACGGDEQPFASSAPTTIDAGVTTPDTTPETPDTTPVAAGDTTTIAPTETPSAIDPAAQPLFDRLLADDAQLTLLVDNLDLREVDPLVIQQNLRVVRDHLFAIDGAVRAAEPSSVELADAQVAFLTRLSPIFPAIDAVTTIAPIEVGPSNLRDLMSPILDAQLGLFDLQVAALRATGVAVNADGDLSASVVTPLLLEATGVTDARVVWAKTTDDESLCGQPLPAGSPQPLVRQQAPFLATELYGTDTVEVFATEADASAFLAAYIADTSCLVADPAIAIIPNDEGWSIADQLSGYPYAATSRQDGNVVYRGNVVVDSPDVADSLLLGSTVAFAVSG